MKKTRCLIVLLFVAALCFGTDPGPETFYGPLWARSIFIPFSLYYQLPGIKAAPGAAGSVWIGHSLFCGQAFINYAVDNSGPEPVFERIEDFETLTLENIVSYSPTDGLELGATLRLVLLYGGFLDPLIRGFHDFFGFPDNNRDIFPENDIFISIPNVNHVRLELDCPAVGLGDTDIWVKISLLADGGIFLSGLCALKLPTGSAENLLGSGYPDFACGLLFDWYISERFAFYADCALIIPFDAIDPAAPSKPYIMLNSLLGIEYAVSSSLSLLAELELRTSPIYSDFVVITDTDIDFFATPQTNLMLGLALKNKNWAMQFYFKEDLFTHDAADIMFNAMIRYNLFQP
jgi:hypothetical protein